MNKKLLAVAVASAVTAPMAAQAIDFKISGHVNRLIRFADDGKGSDIQQLDNSASRSRFRFTGSGDVGNGMKAGINLETSWASNVSGATPLKVADGFDVAFDIRHSALYFSGTWGKVTMGHTSQATDGIAFADLSGTGITGDEVSGTELCSSCLVRTSGGGTAGTIGSYRSSYDGGRIDVLRYDSPALGPATIAASVANDEEWDVAAFVDHNVGGGTLALYGGYLNSENRKGYEQWAISGGFLFSQGTNITITYGERDRVGGGTAGRTSENIYVKLGHKWGNNAISGGWGETSDQAAKGVDGTMWGFGWVHTLKKPGIEIYAGYKNYDNDASAAGIANLGLAAGSSLEDNNTFVVGSRIKFQ
jgi:predicted porin